MEDIILFKPKELKEAKRNEFLSGDRPDGSEIGRYRNYLMPNGITYSMFKNQMNPLAGEGYVDLIFTGQFERSLFPRRNSNNSYIFASTDSKADDLIAKYGIDIMGLNQESFNKLQKEKYAFDLVRYIKKRIGQ